MARADFKLFVKQCHHTVRLMETVRFKKKPKQGNFILPIFFETIIIAILRKKNEIFDPWKNPQGGWPQPPFIFFRGVNHQFL